MVVVVIVTSAVAGCGCMNNPGGTNQSIVISPNNSQDLSPSPGASVPVPPANTRSSGKIQVITSFRPITLLVAPVGGDHITITQILPPGADPHDYEPTPNDAVALRNGKVFFYDGPFLEPWAANLAASANPDIRLATFADAIPVPVYNQMKSMNPNFPNMTEDPHLWLSPQVAEYFVPLLPGNCLKQIRKMLQITRIMPRHLKNGSLLLDADYRAGLSNCTTRTFLTSHAFLDYTAAAYNLTAISIAGLSPDAEPSVKQMSAIVDEAKAQNVKGVLAEPDEAEDLSKAVSTELNLPVYSFTTMEVLPTGPLTPDDMDYVAVMENNLQEMKKAMACQ